MLELQETNIKDMIYTIRGQQVMLDSDLARLYQCANGTKSINLACKRNIEKFPERFRFQITKEEYKFLRFQNETLRLEENVTSKYLPYVFTEQGVAMLATVLKTSVATRVSIGIMDAFVEMRHCLLENKSWIDSEGVSKRLLQINQNTITIQKLDSKLNEITSDVSLIKDDISKIMDNFLDESKIKEFVFVDGQKFEADVAYINLYKLAKKTIYVVDDYVSIKTLSHLKHKSSGVNVILFTDNKGRKDKLQQVEVTDFNNEYPLLEVKETNNLVHDRLIVLDYGTSDEKIYLCGASSKDAGAKFCAILQVHDISNYHGVIDKLLLNNLVVL